MKRAVVGALMGLLLVGFAAGTSSAENGPAVKGERYGHEEGVSRMEQISHRRMGMMGAEHRLRRALADLGLDETQKEGIREIGRTAKKDAIRKMADIRIARIELREILDKDTVDMGAVEAKLRQMEALRTELRLSRIKALEEIKSKLTPEQRQKFRQNLRKQFGRHNGWSHERKGMMPPHQKGENK